MEEPAMSIRLMGYSHYMGPGSGMGPGSMGSNKLCISVHIGLGEEQGFGPIVTGRNEVVAKVIFLHLFVILFTGKRCLPQCMLGYQPPGVDTPQEQTPPRSRHPPGPETTPLGADPPQEQTPSGSRHPPRADTPPRGRHPPDGRHPLPGADIRPESRLQHMQPVRILLECILVSYCATPVPCTGPYHVQCD